jgi:2-hydroxychromene-2-carboxylate isomerase
VTRQLDFYFDFISPFGWLASLRVDEMAARHGYQTRWQSMLLGVSVLKVMGMKPLRQYPLKGDYLKRDLLRYMRKHGLSTARDLDTPPANPLAAGHIFHLVDAQNAPLAKDVARALLQAYWMQILQSPSLQRQAQMLQCSKTGSPLAKVIACCAPQSTARSLRVYLARHSSS